MSQRPVKLLSERDLHRVRIEMLRDLTGHEAIAAGAAPVETAGAAERPDLWSALLMSLAARPR